MSDEVISISDADLESILSGNGISIAEEPSETEESAPVELETLPENSPSLLVDESISRFSSASWLEKIQEKEIVIGGAGGIGSWTALLIARLHPAKMYIYDNDRVDASNLGGQLYGDVNIGEFKTNALSNILRSTGGYHGHYSLAERYTDISATRKVMICGFDSMTSRKTFFNRWKRGVGFYHPEERKDCLYIDGRLAAENFQIFCIRGDDEYNKKLYEDKYLFDDSEADETICSYKQTSFCAAMIASFMANLFVNFCANQANPIIDRDLPFLTEYSAETMYLKTVS